MTMKKGLFGLAIAANFLLSSCGEAPTNCECKNTLDLVVNHEQNAATTYVGQFDKDVYDACIDQFKESKGIKGEVHIEVAYRSYEESCIE